MISPLYDELRKIHSYKVFRNRQKIVLDLFNVHRAFKALKSFQWIVKEQVINPFPRKK